MFCNFSFIFSGSSSGVDCDCGGGEIVVDWACSSAGGCVGCACGWGGAGVDCTCVGGEASVGCICGGGGDGVTWACRGGEVWGVDLASDGGVACVDWAYCRVELKLMLSGNVVLVELV